MVRFYRYLTVWVTISRVSLTNEEMFIQRVHYTYPNPVEGQAAGAG